MIYFFDDFENFCSEKYLCFLPNDRRKRYERLQRKSDRDNCIVAYLLLQLALAENGINSFEIATGENGKPFLKNKEVFFNISHCSDGVTVAIDAEPIGLDAQEIGEYKEKVAKRFFSAEENRRICFSDNKAETFTRIWTLNESIIKCEGKALLNLNEYSFENDEDFFEKYGKKFSCLREKNVLISVCGSKYFDKIKKVKTEEFI